MRRVFNLVTAGAVALAFSSMVFAVPPRQAEQKPAEKTAVKAEKKSTALSANGTVEKFDEATKTLTVGTKEGPKEFTLGPDAKIMEGANAATPAEMNGKHVKVTYSHVNGKNVASKVTIATSTTAKKTVKK